MEENNSSIKRAGRPKKDERTAKYSVSLLPSVKIVLCGIYGTLPNALNALFELENGKNKNILK